MLVRNGALINKIERKVQTFFTFVGGVESNLSDHYAMEFKVSFSVQTDETIAQVKW